MPLFFFFNDTATTEIYTLSLHDALPIFNVSPGTATHLGLVAPASVLPNNAFNFTVMALDAFNRSEEHTSELQSLAYLVCRLLLEKKKNTEHKTYACTPHLITTTSLWSYL